MRVCFTTLSFVYEPDKPEEGVPVSTSRFRRLARDVSYSKAHADLRPIGLSSSDDLLTTTFYPYICRYQILVAKKPESVKKQLRLLRDGFVQLTGYNDFPRPYICVQYISFHVLSDMINQVKDRLT